jgi:hypothetical protein
MHNVEHMTTAEVAKHLGVTVSTVSRLASGDKPRLPPAIKFPGARGPLMFDRNAVEDYAASRRARLQQQLAAMGGAA